MIDASAFVEVLLATGVGGRVRARHLEIVHVLRRLYLLGELQPSRAAQALEVLSGLRMVRRPHEPYDPRFWQLRHSLTA